MNTKLTPQSFRSVYNFIEQIQNSSQAITGVEILNSNILQVAFKQPNVALNKVEHFAYLYDLQSLQKITPTPIPYRNITQMYSINKNFKAVLDHSGEKKEQVFQVFSKTNTLVKQIKLEKYHEKVIQNDILGYIHWNQEETKFLYIAQPKQNNGKFWSETEMNSEKDLQDYLKFHQYKQDCGEQLNDVYNPQIYEYDVKNDSLSQIIIPENVLPCYPQYIDKEGTKIVFQGFKEYQEFRYSIVHCSNRQADLFITDQRDVLYPKPKEESKENKENEDKPKYCERNIISEDYTSFRPIVSPDLSKIVYFNSIKKGQHINYKGIKVIHINDNFKIEQISTISQQYQEEFMGIVGFYDIYMQTYWTKNSQQLIFSTYHQEKQQLHILDFNSKEVKKLQNNLTGEFKNSVTSVLDYDLQNNTVFTMNRSPGRYQQVNMINLDQSGYDIQQIEKSQKTFNIYDNQENINGEIEVFREKYIDETILNHNDVQCIMIRLKPYSEISNDDIPTHVKEIWGSIPEFDFQKMTEEQRPMLVYSHGGPHASSVQSHQSKLLQFFLLCGCTVIFPQFSGSLGYGQDFIDRLAGNIGEMDVNEIVSFVKQVIDQKLCDPNKVFHLGGSYGGQLGAYIAGQHSELFNSVVLMNPVLDLMFEQSMTDIPDWVQNVTFGVNDCNWKMTKEQYGQLYDKSPITHPPKIPVLNLIGAKDRRVPYSQSFAYQAGAIQNGTKIHTFTYMDADHSLADSQQTMVDEILKIVIFINNQLSELQQ